VRKFREDRLFIQEMRTIRKWLARQSSITMVQLWGKGLKRNPRDLQTAEAQRIAFILTKKLGWEKSGSRIVDAKGCRHWEYRPKPPIVAIYEDLLG